VDENKKLLTDYEVAKMIGLSVSATRARRLKGYPPSYLKIGKAVRYRLEDIENYMTSCFVETKKDDSK